MKFLVDNSIFPSVSYGLKNAGFDSIHVRDYNLQDADDETIFKRALSEDRILISADTDFGMILSTWDKNKPSIIIFRRSTGRQPQKQIALLLVNLPEIENHLEKGSLVIIEETRIRIRTLPF